MFRRKKGINWIVFAFIFTIFIYKPNLDQSYFLTAKSPDSCKDFLRLNRQRQKLVFRVCQHRRHSWLEEYKSKQGHNNQRLNHRFGIFQI